MQRRKWLVWAGLVLVSVIAVLWVAGCGGGGDESGAVSDLAPAQVDDQGMMRVLIGFAAQPGQAEGKMVRAAGGSVLRSFHLVPAISALIPERAKQALERNPNVEYVEGDPEASVFVYYGTQPTPQTVDWGIDRIDADLAWSTCDGAGVRVAVLDTGISGPAVGQAVPDPSGPHPDLELNVAGGTNIVNGAVDQAHDDNGHGTHVAGIIGAINNDMGMVGVAPAVSLYSVKVLGVDGNGYYSWIIDGLEWCVDNGMQVANMSLGGAFPSRSLNVACANAYASGVLLVAAAGNEGGRVSYPAKYASVIAVSAIGPDGNVTPFSNTGSEVELCAPGVSVLSTCDQWVDGSDNDQDGVLDGWAVLGGTSMSAPHVAGTAALIIDSGVAGPGAVRARLQESAEDLGPVGRDDSYGFGLVDAEAAVGSVTPVTDIAITAVDASGSVVLGTSADVNVKVANVGNQDVTGDLSVFLSDDTDSVIIGTGTVSGGLAAGASTVLSYSWDTAGSSLGDHTLTASHGSGDDNPANDSKSTVVTIVSESTSGGMYIWDIGWSTWARHLVVTVTVRVDSDGDGVAESTDDLVSGATVNMALTLGAESWSYIGTTDSSGQVQFTRKRAASGTYTATVNNIAHDSHDYDSSLDVVNGDTYTL